MVVSDTQKALTEEEKDEREMEEADAAYQEELENPEEAAADMEAELARKEKEATGAEYQKILIALGFTRYDNREKGISCKLKTGLLQIGRTFTDKQPTGNMWVKVLEDCAFGKKDEFLNKDACIKIPQVKLFYDIRDGILPIPDSTVQGKVVGKSEKAIQIQFTEFGQIRTEWWGFKAVYSSEEGVKYIPASYSKETKHYVPKMQAPRDLLLVNYEAELKDAEISTTATDTGKREEEVEKEEVAKGTVADKIKPHKDPVTLAEGEEPTVDYYVSLIGEITEKINAEERIPEQERGYGISKVFDAVTKDRRARLIAVLKNGGEE